MTKTIYASDLSEGWVNALEYLLTCGGKDINVTVVIEQIREEHLQVRQLLDTFLQTHHKDDGKDIYPVTTVANTLFPQALYNPSRGSTSRDHLYQTYAQSFPVIKRLRANNAGTYFQRMISWPKENGINQLEFVIKRLSAELAKPGPLSSAYEIGVSEVEETIPSSITEEIRVYTPGQDNKIIGFPCLSHISLTFFKKKLHLTALYRNQYFIHKAYGNYLGLCHLLQFICQEVHCEAGGLVCIASHADAELGLGKRAITSLVEQCKASLKVC